MVYCADKEGDCMRVDMHIHTRFSVDSKETMQAYCERALALGLDAVCFTDHLDYNPKDTGFGFYDVQGYFAAAQAVRAQYAGRLRVLFGVEFAEPHLYPEELAQVQRLPYDFVLGSIHFWLEGLFASEAAKSPMPLEESFLLYWQAVENAVEHGGFDSLAHVDFPKRYYRAAHYPEQQLLRIFAKMAQKGIALEINTSTVRGGYGEAMPGPRLLELYRQAGGRDITLGSDAHCAQDLYSDILACRQLAEKLGLREVVFIGRQKRDAVAG